MKVTFLGTGTSQGVPVIACNCEVCHSSNSKDKRLRSSILIESENTSIVIDSGPDFRQQLLRINLQKLDAIVYTHQHKDHIAGMDDVRAFNYRYSKAIDLFATQPVQAALHREFEYVFAETRYPGIPEVKLNTIHKDQPFTIGDIHLTPIEVLHYKMPVLGYRIGDFTYITDAKTISDAEKEKIKGSKILVLNALRREPHISHFTFEEAIALATELQPEICYFTHISHQLGTHDYVQAELPDFIKLAYDGLEIDF